VSEAPTVIKVGGSLFDLPDLGTRLEAWLGTLPARDVILIAGGGAAADVIREMDNIHGLGEARSHWLALRALSLMAHALSEVLSEGDVIENLGDSCLMWPQGGIPILDLYAFARRDESQPGHLPHRWDVTSDSLAARVAEVVEAHELILLKSVTVPPDMDWTEASRHGHVDGYFPALIARGVKARAVNLRQWQP
jgi:aspartokinase-like uncharacterized kinase